jgi:AcrR family transcriptional regulator
LREELIAAADRLLARTGDEEGLSLRAVAREVGIAAPSIYLHFRDKEELVRAVLEVRFAELSAEITAAAGRAPDPAGKLRAGCLAYCRFGLEHPNAYQVLFGNVTAIRAGDPPDRAPGLDAFGLLVDGVRGCMESGAAPPGDPFRVATNVWASLHGIVSLRRSAPSFPWPPVEVQVADALAGLVGVRRDAPAS